jgi:hypothetical protein
VNDKEPGGATKCHPAVVSVTKTPPLVGTVEKFVGPDVSLNEIVPAVAVTAVVAMKVTTYVAVAFATRGDGVTVTAVTELPMLMELVVSTAPAMLPPAQSGCTGAGQVKNGWIRT